MPRDTPLTGMMSVKRDIISYSTVLNGANGILKWILINNRLLAPLLLPLISLIIMLTLGSAVHRHPFLLNEHSDCSSLIKIAFAFTGNDDRSTYKCINLIYTMSRI